MSEDNVIPLRRSGQVDGSRVLQCECGDQWLQPQGIILELGEDDKPHVTGWAYPLKCCSCGKLCEP